MNELDQLISACRGVLEAASKLKTYTKNLSESPNEITQYLHDEAERDLRRKRFELEFIINEKGCEYVELQS